MIIRRFTILLAVFAGINLLLSTGCGNSTKTDGNGTDTGTKDTPTVGPSTINGKIFSVPSPIETAFLIKKSGANYDKGMLNPAESVNSYSTAYQKALMLGVYGADLGYITLYEQTPEALPYFQSVQKLANDIGVSAAFDKTLLERFQKNIGKKDSMLVLVSSAYRASDNFLKNNDRAKDGALIIAGGWVESLYFASKLAISNKNADIIKRISEQKSSIESLIGLMQTYQGEEQYGELIKGLEDLKTDFDGIEYKYVYNKPETDEAKMITTFKSTTDATISQQQLESIAKKVEALRKLIVS